MEAVQRPGAEMVRTQDRKDALVLIGKLVRLTDRMGLSVQAERHLTALLHLVRAA
jgi:hypothetical protein